MTTTTTTPAQAQAIIAIAKNHLGNGAAMATSAQAAYDDALSCLGRGEYHYAAARAIDSLGYSIGILHADHVAAKAIFNAAPTWSPAEKVTAEIDYTVETRRGRNEIVTRKTKPVHATRAKLGDAVARAQVKLRDVGAFNIVVRWPA